MWTLTKQVRFEASHVLYKHDGKCSRVHGHSWIADVSVSGTILIDGGPQHGMLFDYSRLSALLKTLVVDELDHYHLNDILPFYPTSENISKWIGSRLGDTFAELFPDRRVVVDSVVIHETCTSRCTWRPDVEDAESK